MKVSELIKQLQEYPEDMVIQIQIYETDDHFAWWDYEYYDPDLKEMYQDDDEWQHKILVIY